MLKLNLQSFFTNSIRFLVTVCLFAIIFTSNAIPASAAITRSDEGTTKLNEIQKRTDDLTKRTDDIAKRDNSVAPSLKESQSATRKGINEIQGDADKDKMISPEDAKNVTTLEDKIKNSFSKVTGSK